MTNTKEISSKKLLESLNAEHLKNEYRNIPWQDWELSDIDLCHLLDPSQIDWRLRIRFWDLVEKVLGNNPYDMIYTIDICEGITDPRYFRQRFKKRYFASFLFRPIENYTDEVGTMLAVTRGKLWSIINAINPIKEDKTINFPQANLLMRIHSQLVDRKMGAVKQLVEMKKVQLNIKANSAVTDDIELLDAQIRELKPRVELIPKQRDIALETEEDGIS